MTAATVAYPCVVHGCGKEPVTSLRLPDDTVWWPSCAEHEQDLRVLLNQPKETR